MAIEGASHHPTKLGYGLSRNPVQSGYRGAIHFVNLKGGSLMGRPVSARLGEVPDPVDLVVMLIPAGRRTLMVDRAAGFDNESFYP